MKRRIIPTALLTTTLLTMYAAETPAVETGTIGGPGGTSYALGCDPRQRITGIRVTRSNIVVDKIRFRCTPINNQGRWDGGHTWTAYTPSSAPIPGTVSSAASCSRDRFVGGFRAFLNTVGPRVIARVEIACFQANNTLGRVGTPRTPMTSQPPGVVGFWLPWLYCRPSELAQSGYGKSGWHLDSLGLICRHGGDVLAAPIPAPTPAVTRGPILFATLDANTLYQVGTGTAMDDQGNNYALLNPYQNSPHCAGVANPNPPNASTNVPRANRRNIEVPDIAWSLRNNGSAAANNVTVELVKGGQVLNARTIAVLNPSQQVTFSFRRPASSTCVAKLGAGGVCYHCGLPNDGWNDNGVAVRIR